MKIKDVFIDKISQMFGSEEQRLTIILENDRYEAVEIDLLQDVEFLADNLRDLADRLTERSREEVENHGRL